jgi:hypothetical protein
MNSVAKQLVVIVPDHLAEYIDFKWIIPGGSYDAGLTVFLA